MLEIRRIDSELGSWTQRHWRPQPDDALANDVECIWDFEGTLAAARERTFPDGMLQIVVQLDEPHRPATQGELADPFPAVCVDGLQTVSTAIEGPRGRCRVLGIRMRPLGAFAVMGPSLGELSDRCVDLQVVMGAAATELGERLDAARDGNERVRVAEAWARGRLERAARPAHEVSRVLCSIDRDGGNSTITQLDTFLSRSRSRLAAVFRDQVGLTPKRYARIIRFRRAMELIQHNGSRLSEIAAASGYYDQAHMNAEFREHAGLTPRGYANALRYPNSGNLAEVIGQADAAGVGDSVGSNFQDGATLCEV
jgi:AraC-like DNA-binding protein